jgi:hypothetical protein
LEEWAALEEFALSTGQSPGRAAKALVVDALGHVARRGPAAPEVEEVSAPAVGPRVLREVVAGSLAERFGSRMDHPATARQMIAAGRVSVDGRVVRSAEWLVGAGAAVVVS